MARPKKKQIVLSKDSVLSLMQEIYNELVEQRATAIRIQNKMLAKKLSLSKLQSTIWEKTSNTSSEDFSLSEIDDDTLQTLIQQDLSNDDKKDGYKL